ncbi:MAG: hypothetical protein QOH97_1274 [Actinoplanes sp.]|nr:hypothetical protein [Actinoplanes sp.]
MRMRAEFTRLVERILAECRANDVDLSHAAVEDLVAVRVTAMAKALRVQEATIVRSHLSTIDPTEFVAELRFARAETEREVANTSPTVFDLDSAGRLVASLGQAVRCMSLNHQSLAGSERDKWEAIGVLDAAGDGLTLLGEALKDADNTAGRVSVLLSDEAVVHARNSIEQTISNLTSGKWSFGHGASLDAGVAKRMAQDLALLPGN